MCDVYTDTTLSIPDIVDFFINPTNYWMCDTDPQMIFAEITRDDLAIKIAINSQEGELTPQLCVKITLCEPPLEEKSLINTLKGVLELHAQPIFKAVQGNFTSTQ